MWTFYGYSFGIRTFGRYDWSIKVQKWWRDDSPLYVRKYEEFISLVDKVKYPNVNQKYRFELQDVVSVKDKFNK